MEVRMPDLKMLDKADIFVPFAKSERQQDGSVLVYGKVTDATVDLDGQIADPSWSKAALTDWFERAANIREMHQPSAVGKGVELVQDGDATYLKAKIVDPVAATKVTEGVYTGYSWGAKRPIVVPDPTKKAPGGIIKGGLIVEVSVVDQPANPAATFTLAKMSFEEMNAIDPDLAKREFSTEERERMSESGTAMPDGSYPIANRNDLKNAIQAFGRAKNPEKVKEHIMRRARALKLDDMIPENWTSKTKAAEGDATTEGEQVSKVEQVMKLVRELIAEEAMESHGDDETQCLEVLISALRTLSMFRDMESEEVEEMLEMAAAASLVKAGRAISKATEGHLFQMHDAITKLMGDKMCKGYMAAAMADEEDEEDDKESAPATKALGVESVTRQEFDALKAELAKLAALPAPSPAYFGGARTKVVEQPQQNTMKATMAELAKSGDPATRQEAQRWLDTNKE